MSRPMPAFMHGSLERLSGHRNEPERVAAMLANAKSRYAVFSGDKLLVHSGPAGSGGIWWHEREELPDAMSGVEPVLLGLDADGVAHFAMQAAVAERPLAAGQAAVDLRSIALQGLVDDGMLGVAAQARALLHWHVRHRFCSNCGATTVAGEAGYKRVCGTCSAEHFPRTDPVVIMAVVRDQYMLLGRSGRFSAMMYSTLAGFVEPGETAEDAARREVEEESGIKVGAVRYVMSQPWPFPANLMIGMIGEGLNDTIDIDPDELADARWFSFDDVRAMRDGKHPEGLEIPPSISIAHHLIVAALDESGD